MEQFDFDHTTEKYFFHKMAGFFTDEESNKLFVACGKGKVCGSLCVLKRSEDKAELALLGVAKAFQREG